MANEDLTILREILAKMLEAGISITARAVVRDSQSPYRHASDITRQPMRNALLLEFQSRQIEVRRIAEKTGKTSKTTLQAKIEKLQHENERLKKEKEILIASHRAMLLAVAECGGMSAWRKLFPGWDETIKSMAE